MDYYQTMSDLKKMSKDWNAEEQFQKAFYIGLLEGKLKEMFILLENANDEIKQLQYDLIAKESK
jgi:hypothetical protein